MLDGTTKTFNKRLGQHQASAPGDPPAVYQGALRASISHSKPEWSGDMVTVRVGTRDPKAPWLEFGYTISLRNMGLRVLRKLTGGRVGKSKKAKLSYVAPRPFWRVSIAEATPKVIERFNKM